MLTGSLCFRMTNCLMLQAVVFTLERTMLLLYLHKPADLLRIEKQRGFSLPQESAFMFWLTSFPGLANALLFADGTVDSWTQSYVEVVRNSQKRPCSISLLGSWIQDLRSLNHVIHSWQRQVST